jgi:hypothetical protein
VATGSGSTLDSTSDARGVTEFARPEESSGIIDVTDDVREANWYEKGRRYYLADMQAHYGLPAPLVQGGQLYLLISPKQ